VTSVNLTATPSEKRSPEMNFGDVRGGIRRPEAQNPLPTLSKPGQQIGQGKRI
jgi:hypothetical protein